MYALLSGLWKYMFQKDEYFVLILGLDNAGKTTYLEQTKTKFNKKYKAMNLSKVTTTVGLNIGKIDVGSTRLNFWDLGGQEELQSLWDKYYAESHALIYIVDSSDRERIRESKQAFDTLIPNETLGGVPLLMLANKQDLEGCMTVGDVRKIFRESSHLIGHRECMMAGVSALKGMVLHFGRKDAVFKWLKYCESGHSKLGAVNHSYRYCLRSNTPTGTLDGVDEGIDWLVQAVQRNNIHRPPTQKDITR